MLELLASGGMGEVYVARARGPQAFQKLVALKRVLPHLEQEEEFVAMFLEEARLAATLDHPNIVQVIELGQSPHGYFLTMEHVHGVDLRALLRQAARTEAIPLGCALGIASALAAGLHYAHERTGPDGQPMGLVHRDVSPSNVLITYDGVVKLVDFGVAKAAAQTARTRATMLKGKVGYMSPEQCRGIPVDRRSDVFSLGVLLYELTTLHRPFYEDNHFAALNRIVQGEYERPSALVPDYSPGLEQIVMQALDPDPARRYPTARAMLDDLERLAQAQGVRASSAVLADYVVEQLGRPPPPSYGAVASSAVTDVTTPPAVSTVVAGPPPSGALARGQMWLAIGLVATAMMSLATLVITLLREPVSVPPTASPGAGPGPEPDPAPTKLAPAASNADVVSAGRPEDPPGHGRPVRPRPETPVQSSAPSGPEAAPPEPEAQPAKSSRPEASRRAARKRSRPRPEPEAPSKPSFDSIFPPG